MNQRHEAILVPIYGVMVPFHILTLKNATVNQDGSVAFIRLNFNFGGRTSASALHALYILRVSCACDDSPLCMQYTQIAAFVAP